MRFTPRQLPSAFALCVLIVNSAWSQQSGYLDFSDEPMIFILDEPDSGTPTRDGNCIGGCANAAGGAPSFSENPPQHQFQAPSGRTEFRQGTFEVGPTNANGGYTGSLFRSFAPGDPFALAAHAGISASNMVTPDFYFPRQQIMLDLDYLTGMRDVISAHRRFTRVPQVFAPLPPTPLQFREQINASFERHFGAMRAAGHFYGDWDQWVANLHTKTLPGMLDTAVKRDLPLSEAYYNALSKQSDRTERLITDVTSSEEFKMSSRIFAFEESAGRTEMIIESERRVAVSDGVAVLTGSRISGVSSKEFWSRQRAAEMKIATAVPTTQQGGIAKVLAQLALADGERAWLAGQEGEAAILQKLSFTLLDIALGFTPIVGVARDAYEFLTGTSLITGEPLSESQRILAGASLATVGILGSAAATFRVLNTFEHSTASALRLEGGQFLRTSLSESAPRIEVFRHRLSPLHGKAIVTGVREAEEENLRVLARAAKSNRSRFTPTTAQAPWNSSSLVTHLVTEEPLKVVRFHGAGNRNGRWFALEEDVRGLTNEQIQRRFGLPSAPEFISHATIPRGTKIITGEVGPTTFGLNHGARQIHVPSAKVRDKWFSGPPTSL